MKSWVSLTSRFYVVSNAVSSFASVESSTSFSSPREPLSMQPHRSRSLPPPTQYPPLRLRTPIPTSRNIPAGPHTTTPTLSPISAVAPLIILLRSSLPLPSITAIHPFFDFLVAVTVGTTFSGSFSGVEIPLCVESVIYISILIFDASPTSGPKVDSSASTNHVAVVRQFEELIIAVTKLLVSDVASILEMTRCTG